MNSLECSAVKAEVDGLISKFFSAVRSLEDSFDFLVLYLLVRIFSAILRIF
jgi:hypothetical protein